jgi:predicted HicB family RNase H-like nuclease
MVIKNEIARKIEYYSKLPYTVIVEQWDDGQGLYWVARIAELPHCLIHADTPEEAIIEIQEVKMDWIKSNLERGITIPEPRPRKYSGQIRLRISPSLHKLLTHRAETEGLSLNQYMATTLAMSVGITSALEKRANADNQEAKGASLLNVKSRGRKK